MPLTIPDEILCQAGLSEDESAQLKLRVACSTPANLACGRLPGLLVCHVCKSKRS